MVGGRGGGGGERKGGRYRRCARLEEGGVVWCVFGSVGWEVMGGGGVKLFSFELQGRW